MPELTHLIAQIKRGEDLNHSDAGALAQAMTEQGVDGELKKEALLALAQKGETPVEVESFARLFRSLALDPKVSSYSARAIDVVGTGGDRSGSFNISSTTAFVLAAAGIPVMKHGNRSITSKCGSADFLSGVGIPLETDVSTLQKSLKELNFCFFFAPAFHPVFKHIMPLRKELAAEGHRTIFNILGPLINPGQPTFQLLGVYSPQWLSPLANALHQLGLTNGYVVHCTVDQHIGLDEAATVGKNLFHGFGQSIHEEGAYLPESLGMDSAPLKDIAGGSAEDNLEILQKLYSGKATNALEDTIALNAGLGMKTTGHAATLEEGIQLARDIILGGQLKLWLSNVRDFYCK